MKKIIVILFALLILAGCTSEKGYSKLSNGDDVIFTGPETSYTKQDLYQSLKYSSVTSIEKDILKKIAETLDVDFEAINKEADEMVEMYLSMGYESLIISYYGSIDAFKENYISSAVLTELSKIYVNNNYDKFVADDKPVKMQMAYFDNEETAQKLIDDIKAGSTFDMAAANNGYESSCEVQVYLDSDELLPLNVKSYLNETVSKGLSTIIVVPNSSNDEDGNTSENSKYYVLNIESRNVEEFKDEYIEAKINSLGEDSVKQYMFSNHEIKFFDQDIYEIMKEQYEVFE